MKPKTRLHWRFNISSCIWGISIPSKSRSGGSNSSRPYTFGLPHSFQSSSSSSSTTSSRSSVTWTFLFPASVNRTISTFLSRAWTTVRMTRITNLRLDCVIFVFKINNFQLLCSASLRFRYLLLLVYYYIFEELVSIYNFQTMLLWATCFVGYKLLWLPAHTLFWAFGGLKIRYFESSGRIL